MRRLFGAAALSAAIFALVGGAGATSPTTTGTWYSYPPQTSTTTTTTTTGTTYKSAVRPPINADGSSNWPAKRGVISVQVDLLAAPSTTTTTTTTYAPPVWESIGSDTSTANDYSFAGLNLSPTLTFSQITNLSADYLFTQGDCFGGSLRWDVYLSSAPNVIHVYYGNPNGPDQGCSSPNQSGDNLITTSPYTANRFEIGNTGVYTDYTAALAATGGGTATVTGAQLTLDSGWKADQRATISNVRSTTTRGSRRRP